MQNRLKEVRKSANLTQVELARKTGINRVTIARIERNHHDMSLRNAQKIAKALNVKIDDLIRE